MPSVDEAASSYPAFIAPVLRAGVDQISEDQVVTFRRYVRVVLPLDGFVFFVRADLLSSSALLAASNYASAALAAGARVLSPAAEIKAQGSLHYSINQAQEEDASPGVGTIIFTSEVEIEDLAAINPGDAYIAEIDGNRFSFSQLAGRYYQAGLWHYRGDILTSPFDTQIVDDPALLNARDLVVSNSLPAWLSLGTQIPVFPSYAIPANIRPPYISVAIDESDTDAIQPLPFLDRSSSSWQLMQDRVRLIMYGLRNQQAIDWMNYALAYMGQTEVIGLMEGPTLRDTKKLYPELNILAMRKTLEFRVSYYQLRINAVARQLILSCIPSFEICGYEPTPLPSYRPGWEFIDPRNFATRSFLGQFHGHYRPV